LQNEKTFNNDLQDLGVEIRKLLSCLAEVKDQAKLVHLKGIVVDIMKAICQAAEFINEYLKQNILGVLHLTYFIF
jgi:hypothetical protein